MSLPTAESITFDTYQRGARMTAIYPGKGTVIGLYYTALGLGEVGELQGKVKKILRDSGGAISDEARAAITAELGDCLWYCAMVAEELDIRLSDAAVGNLRKLRDRANRGTLQGSGDDR